MPRKEGKSKVVGDSKNNIVCFCCGTPGHTKFDCKYKTLNCLKCNRQGHLKRVCKAKTKTSVNNLEQST